VAVIDLDPAQGASSHFWPRERTIGHAASAGLDVSRLVDDRSPSFPNNLHQF
jgi:hypothetical protein